MVRELDYKPLIYMRDGLLVVQIKKGYFQLRHHSGLSPYLRCFKSKDVAMQAFDTIFPLAKWTRSMDSFQKMSDIKRDELRSKIERALEDLKSYKAPEED
jgi:hypothetical protein